MAERAISALRSTLSLTQNETNNDLISLTEELEVVKGQIEECNENSEHKREREVSSVATRLDKHRDTPIALAAVDGPTKEHQFNHLNRKFQEEKEASRGGCW
jgi:hypothetical protein